MLRAKALHLRTSGLGPTSRAALKFVAGLAFFAGLAGCGEVVAPPREPTRPRPVVAERAPTAVAPATAALPTSLRRIWIRQTPPFQLGIAATSDHLVSLSTERLYLFALRDGEAIRDRDACLTFEGGLGRLGADVAIVCDREIQIVAVPSLELRDRKPLRARAERAAFAPDHVAIASDDGMVRVFARSDWATALELSAGAVDALAVAPDGSKLALARGGEVFVHDGGTPRRITSTTLAVEALAFSPSGEQLFVTGPGGGVFDLQGQRLAALSSAGNLGAAVWPAPGLLVAAGSAGLMLVAPESGGVRSVPGDLGGSALVALAASPDGSTVCASDRDGRIACHAQGEAPKRVDLEPASRDERRMAGRVRGHDGRRLIIAAEPEAPVPAEGTAVKLFRYDEVSGRTRWRELARGRVIVVNGREVRILLERPVESMWGVPEPVPVDAPVELAWEIEKAQNDEVQSDEAEPRREDSGLTIPSPDEAP